MNILVFTTAFYPSMGGIEKQTLHLIQEFLSMGHNVRVIHIQDQIVTSSYRTPPQPGIEVYCRPGFFKTMSLFFWCNTLFMPNFSLKGIWFLFFSPFKKWVVSHNDFYLCDKKSIITRLKLLAIKFASKNISVSKSVAQYIGTDSQVIHNCYDDKIFKVYDEKRLYDFVFLGRLVSQKGVDLLIKACKNLTDSFTLNIIGDGPERPRLEGMVHEYGLEKNVKFLGIMEGEQLAILLNRHKTMVIPSVGEEGFGIVALEGLACGCRIIAANAGGLTEAVNTFGKIFEMGNLEKLEQLLKQELNDCKELNFRIQDPNLKNYLVAHKRKDIARRYVAHFN